MAKDEKTGRRSQAWFGGGSFGFAHRSWMRSESVPTDNFDGRPVIGICNTWSELTPCNSHFRDLAQHVREGILEAGGVPMEFPVISTGETLTRRRVCSCAILQAWMWRRRFELIRSMALCC
jgi:L-arabonate dehydrase